MLELILIQNHFILRDLKAHTKHFFETHRALVLGLLILFPVLPIALPALLADTMIKGHIDYHSAMVLGLLSVLTLLVNRLFHPCFALHSCSPLLTALPLSKSHRLAVNILFQAYIHSFELIIFLLAVAFACMNAEGISQKFMIVAIVLGYLFSLFWTSLLISKIPLSLVTQYLILFTLSLAVFAQSWLLLIGFVAWTFILQKANTRLALNSQIRQPRYLAWAMAKSTHTPKFVLATLGLIACLFAATPLNVDLLLLSLSFLLLAFANNCHRKTIEYFQEYSRQIIYMPHGAALLKRYCYWLGGFNVFSTVVLQIGVWHFLHPFNPYWVCWVIAFISGALFALFNKKYQLVSQLICFAIFLIASLS